jgi:hypothetical protein
MRINRPYKVIIFLFLLLICAVVLFIHLCNENNKTVLEELSSTGTRYSYCVDETLNIKLLFIYYVNSSNFNKVCELLPKLKEPYSFAVGFVKLNQDDMVNLSRDSNLIMLTLTDCEYVPNGSVLKNLSTCQNLQTLGLVCRNSNDRSLFKYIDTVSQIYSLRICEYEISTEELENIIKLRIVNLELMGLHLSNDCMAIISNCHTVKSLSFIRCNFSDNSGIRMISKMKNITTLNLSDCHVSGKILEFFIDHPTMKQIVINGAYLDKDDIEIIENKTHKLPQIIGVPFAY